MKRLHSLQPAHRARSLFQAPPIGRAPEMNRVAALRAEEEIEVLEFLARRPVHTVVMTSWIRDNGLENELNRGEFYGFRSASGALEGVALIGHTTLIEAQSETALAALAAQAKQSRRPIHLMMSDGDSIETFWRHYAGRESEPRLICSERLFEIRHPVMVREAVPGLRPAAAAELLPIAEAHAAVAFEESGVDPLEKDREGFLKRVLRRIEQNRIWVVFEGETLVFKADVVAETPEVIYLEGIYVDSRKRGRGIAARCLSRLSRTLLEKVKYVCLLSNVESREAHRAYARAGFKSKDSCVTIFV
jgi:GNAT superfamily N-acetyltransferase